MMNFQIQPGDIILVDNRAGGIYTKLIRFFGDSNWTHTAVGFYPMAGEPMVFEANLLVKLSKASTYVGNPNIGLKVIRPTGLTTTAGLWNLYDQYDDHTYGISQLPWYVWRWLVLKLTKKNLKNSHNWFPNGGEVCTELTYREIQFNTDWPSDGYSADCLLPRDIEEIGAKAIEAGKAQIVYKQNPK